MTFTTVISLGGVTINAQVIKLERVQSTHKQIVGGTVQIKSAPDKTAQDWKGTIQAIFISSSRNADRDLIQGFMDNNTKVALVDGEHNGDYFVLGVTWNDNGNVLATRRQFTITLIQDQ